MHTSPSPCLRSSHALLRMAVTGLMLAFLATASAPARADADAEREQLAKISYELQRLRRMVEEAKPNAADARVKFQYGWLAKDLELVQRGVDEHLDAPRQPRPVPPLRGDYRQ